MSVRIAVPIVSVGLLCTLFVGCDGGAEQYGWFDYAAPDGWARHVPSPGVTYAPTLVEFRCDSADPHEQPDVRLEVREVTDDARFERIPELFEHTQHVIWRGQSDEAERRGGARPAFACTSVKPTIGGAGEKRGFEVLRERDGQARHALVYFVEHADGRRFRAEYSGTDPEFSAHRDAMTASLSTLVFHAAEPVPQPLSHDQVVAALARELDDERLWLYDGTVEGRRLNDAHLAALSDPAFVGVTDLNLIAGHDAMTGGVDVTDAGLAHLKGMPLKSLCLRGSLVTDAGLAHLKDMPLKTLVLDGTLIKGEGLKHLSGMKKLQVLDLAHTRVGDDALKHLEGLPLVQVFLRRTNVTEEGLAALRAKLPELYVSHE